MALTIGSQLGSHEITALLGKGGMGEVYRARDLKLKREVAIKILPEEFARDGDRVGRFQREAEVLASLNHPNIAGIYDFQEANGSRYLVLELVEGETLADRIARGPIPVNEALAITKSICEALEAAHEKGIIHRDLKPANVKITPDGKVKVLDFGLAKALEGTVLQTISNSPTMLSVAATNAGMILGTAGYMSPEQAKGRAADHRSDIFSIGCILYELLTRRLTFEGETVTEVIASVLKQDPDLSLIPANIHPRVIELVRRCLAKDPRQRWHASADIRVEIETILKESGGLKSADSASAQHSPWKLVFVAAAAAVAGALLAAGILWNSRPKLSPPIMRFSFELPAGQQITRGGRSAIAISADGQNIVYQAKGQLYLRAMSGVDSKVIDGTNQDAGNPFFSPDGKWIGFYSVSERKLKKIAITGGAAVSIAETEFPYGAYWTEDDQILFADAQKGLYRISANGGTPEMLIAAKSGETLHGPQLLPDRDHILFTVASTAGASLVSRSLMWDKAKVVVQSLKTGERKTIIDGGADGRYVPTGHIAYGLGSTLFAIPFNIKTLEKTGGPVPVTEGVLRAIGASGAAHFAFASDGTMVYFEGANGATTGTIKLALVSRDGKETPLPIPAGVYAEPRFSPDEKQVAVLALDESDNLTLSIYDLTQTSALRRLTFQATDHPVWTRDGERLIFQSGGSLFWQRVDGKSAAEELLKPKQGLDDPNSISPDGKTLLFHASDNGGDIWSLSLDGEHKAKSLISAPANQQGAYFSPDGQWVVYSSGGSNQNEIFVQPFPPTGTKYQVTTTGGVSPIWSPDGKQIFYLSNGGPARQLFSVDVHIRPSFGTSPPVKLPINNIVARNALVRPYDIASDGKQFVILERESSADAILQPQMRIVLNWFRELQERVPAK
jgi:serine/threonine-protein kinase